MSKRLPRSRRSFAAAAATAPIIFAAAPSSLPVIQVAAAAPTKTYPGPSASMKFGPVQVTIQVNGTRIVQLTVNAPINHPRSAFINNKADPILRREVLHAQSARGIHAVSGATLTSNAFYTSLLGALHAAHLQ
jgi:uncharacterized protein with FMN-binding domain